MTANGPACPHDAGVVGLIWGWNWIVKVPLPSLQVRNFRIVNAEKSLPLLNAPPPPMNSSMNVPDGHSGSLAVKVPNGSPSSGEEMLFLLVVSLRWGGGGGAR